MVPPSVGPCMGDTLLIFIGLYENVVSSPFVILLKSILFSTMSCSCCCWSINVFFAGGVTHSSTLSDRHVVLVQGRSPTNTVWLFGIKPYQRPVIVTKVLPKFGPNFGTMLKISGTFALGGTELSGGGFAYPIFLVGLSHTSRKYALCVASRTEAVL